LTTPAESFWWYVPTFYAVVFAFSYLVLLKGLVPARKVTSSPFNNAREDKLELPILGTVLLIFVILFIGLRPLSDLFTDMPLYASFVENPQIQGTSRDFLFGVLLSASSSFLTPTLFFLLVAAIYVIPAYWACRTWFGPGRYLGLMMIIGSFTFWAYGTNTIRAGIASSILILAISRNSKWSRLAWIATAIGLHATMLGPALAYGSTFLIKRVRWYFIVWIAAIPISLIFGDQIRELLSVVSFDDSGRISSLSVIADASTFRFTGFRLDFVAVSAVGVAVAWFHIQRNKIHESTYIRIVGTYLLTNAFWIVVINVNYSDRIAYLSWMLLPLVIVYPLLTHRLKGQKLLLIGSVLLANISFTVVVVNI